MQTCLKNDLQSKLANVIFAGFFEHGDDIADHEVLADYAEKVGLASREEVSRLQMFPVRFTNRAYQLEPRLLHWNTGSSGIRLLFFQ